MNNGDMPAQGHMREPSDPERQMYGIGGRNGEPPNVWEKGLTKREHFAGLAMAAMLSNSNLNSGEGYTADELMSLSAQAADALLKELEK